MKNEKDRRPPKSTEGEGGGMVVEKKVNKITPYIVAIWAKKKMQEPSWRKLFRGDWKYFRSS